MLGMLRSQVVGVLANRRKERTTNAHLTQVTAIQALSMTSAGSSIEIIMEASRIMQHNYG
jgi:hypothetical protein